MWMTIYGNTKIVSHFEKNDIECKTLQPGGSVESLVAAAIDEEHLTADPGRSGSSEKQHCLSDVGGLAETVDWSVPEHLLLEFGRQNRFQRGSFCSAGTHVVDAHAIETEIIGQVGGEVV